MLRSTRFLIGLVLLIGSIAWGQVMDTTQVNDWQLSLTGSMNMNGSGSAVLNQWVILPQESVTQVASANGGAATVTGAACGMLGQTGLAVANGAGSMQVKQGLSAQTVEVPDLVPGGQNQTFYSDADAVQSQGLLISGSQSLTKGTGGLAGGVGVNTAVLAQGQVGAGGGTYMAERKQIAVIQISNLSGAGNSQGQATGVLSVLSGQYQEVNEELSE